MSMKNIFDIDLKNKRVLIREDLNVPLRDSKITSDQRILAALPTIQYALQQGAAVIIMSHLGRPQEGQYSQQFSLQPVAIRLSELLQQDVRLEKDWIDGVDIQLGEVVLVENVRFLIGEKENNAELAKKMAALCDVFVMDAFATAHRTQASTVGVALFVKQSAKQVCAGPLLIKELDALGKALTKPKKPMIAIVGGAKVSTKLTVLKSLLDKVDQLIVGGGIANTFMLAAGMPIGESLCEQDLVEEAKQILQLAKEKGADIPLPTDVVVAKEFSERATPLVKSVNDIVSDDMILDIGPETAVQFSTYLTNAETIVWNGPVGVFEFSQFSHGTRTLAEAIAHSKAFSLAGGGDTLAAIDQFSISEHISYISTGGGAFLELLQGKHLPAVDALEN